LIRFFEKVGEVCDVNVEAVRDDTQKRSDEMEQEYGDCSKVLQLLGWKTTTSMKEGLIKTLTVIKAEEAANRSK
jgi:nucleoside-diphosphate-sugar epimerase